jgi:DNA transformation protein
MALTPYVELCLELLAPLGTPRARRMFGGHGLTVDDVFLALIADERLYLKVDEQTRAAFESAGSLPFVYTGKGRSITLSYWTAPDAALDSPPAMLPWARLALQAALRAPPGGGKRPPPPPEGVESTRERPFVDSGAPRRTAEASPKGSRRAAASSETGTAARASNTATQGRAKPRRAPRTP